MPDQLYARLLSLGSMGLHPNSDNDNNNNNLSIPSSILPLLFPFPLPPVPDVVVVVVVNISCFEDSTPSRPIRQGVVGFEQCRAVAQVYQRQRDCPFGVNTFCEIVPPVVYASQQVWSTPMWAKM
jgi:hypothetical protein